MFAIQYGLTFCLYMRSLYETPLYSPSSISIRQLYLMSKYWNALLRHWRSGSINQSFSQSVSQSVSDLLYMLRFCIKIIDLQHWQVQKQKQVFRVKTIWKGDSPPLLGASTAKGHYSYYAIYSRIPWFSRDSTAFLYFLGLGLRLGGP